jgi:CBS domain-containing protein
MTREPTTVTGATTVKETAEILAEHQISSVPVLDERGRLCGVVSEADLIRDAFTPERAYQGAHPVASASASVEDVMTMHVITVRPTTDISEVADLMTSTGVKSIPVIDDDRQLVGVVSRSDLVRVKARADESILREITARLVAMGHEDWLVEVRDGAVEIDGPTGDADRSMAKIITGGVPGVVQVRVR